MPIKEINVQPEIRPLISVCIFLSFFLLASSTDSFNSKVESKETFIPEEPLDQRPSSMTKVIDAKRDESVDTALSLQHAIEISMVKTENHTKQQASRYKLKYSLDVYPIN